MSVTGLTAEFREGGLGTYVRRAGVAEKFGLVAPNRANNAAWRIMQNTANTVG